MFYIDGNSKQVIDAEARHFKELRCFVSKKVEGPKCTDPTCKMCKSRYKKVVGLFKKIETFLTDPLNLEIVLRGDPSDLPQINEEFWKYIFPTYDFDVWLPFFDRRLIAAKSTNPMKPFSQMLFKYIDQINNIFDYERFIDKDSKYYNAYDLSGTLARNTCTYCNRTYTST